MILALDQGTTSSRAILFDKQGNIHGLAQREFQQFYPQAGWVEHDPQEIWLSQKAVMEESLAKTGVKPHAIGITNQRETTIVWDRRTGEPIAPAIVWQCRRTAARCSELAASPTAARVTAKTGLVVDAYFSGSKIEWILNNVPGARERDLLFGNVDTWLIWKLTNGAVHATDPSNASRTMLMNLATDDWDPELLAIFGIPPAMLPRIVPSSGVLAEAAAEHLGAAIPIAGIAGDQQAALVGQACFRAGLSKNTYGTGCFALLHAGGTVPVSRNKLLATRAASTSAAPEYAVEGSVFVAGAAVQWLRDQLGILKTAAESDAIASSVPDSAGVYMVPAFTGLGAPHWNQGARGLISGLTRGASAAHIVRATLESIAYQTRELVEAMEADSGQRLAELRVDGGATANNFLMQFQADILGRPIVRPADIETTALGAAYLAGLAVGYWSGVGEVESFWRVERTFEPQWDAARREEAFAGWKQAVARSM